MSYDRHNTFDVPGWVCQAEKLEILSGEGEQGTRVLYAGKRTVRAIKARLTRERCHGDRWAILIVDGERLG